MVGKEELFAILEEKGISYERMDHIPVFTIEEADEFARVPDYADDTKNLLLVDSKRGQYYMAIFPAHASLNIGEARKTFGAKKLSFAAAEELFGLTGLIPGSVTPFGVLNDTENRIVTIVAEELSESEHFCAHPNKNDCTIILPVRDMARVLEDAGHEVRFMKLPYREEE